jgi:hypothetical protein
MGRDATEQKAVTDTGRCKAAWKDVKKKDRKRQEVEGDVTVRWLEDKSGNWD